MSHEERDGSSAGLAAGRGRSRAMVEYFATVRRFSRNARLFLAYALLSQLGAGIWNVMFNLYLLRLGFSVGFVGLFIMVDMLFHGLVAFPAGLLVDKIGRRKAFFIATCINLAARGVLLFTTDSTFLLVLAGVAGVGEAFHGVAGPPFIMETSEPEERPLLFSLNSMFTMLSRSVGSLLPLAWAVYLGVPDLAVGEARWALVASLPLTLVAIAPLGLMTERRVALAGGFLDLIALKNVVNFASIAKLTLCSLLVWLGCGMATRFFNVFFDLAMGATDRQISAILGFGALAGASAILFSGLLVRKLGKTRSIAISQVVAVPLAVPGLPMVVASFFLYDAFYSISMSVRNQLAMELTVAQERGTTAGMTHMSFDMGGAFGAGMAEALIGVSSEEASLGVRVGEFVPAFTVAGVLVLSAAVLYYVFFAREETAQRVVAPAV